MVKRALIALAIVGLVAPVALAHDTYAVPWRGDAGSTMQHWTFDTAPTSGTIAPEVDNNPFGFPVIQDPYSGSSAWHTVYGTEPEVEYGVNDFFWGFYIDIPNDDTTRPLKEMYIQFTYFYDWNTSHYEAGIPTPSVFWPEGTNSVEEVENTFLGGVNGANWYHSTWYITIEPNPDFETIWVESEGHDGDDQLVIDQIVVDTICIPEPATLALLAMGGLTLLRRRS